MGKKFEFKPFDKVLVRDNDDDIWVVDLYGYRATLSAENYHQHCCLADSWNQCIPYNEETSHLLGTTDDYVEPYEPKDGDFCAAIVEGCKWILVFKEHDVDTNNIDCIRDYFSYSCVNHTLYAYSSLTETKRTTIKPATKEEKRFLLSKLAEIGKQWNPEKKCIEDIWTPKDGDFVVTYEEEIAICSSPKVSSRNGLTFEAYASMRKHNNELFTVSGFFCQKEYRLATDTEKQQLLDALHKENKDWDAEKKEIVEYKWKPSFCENYWTVTDTIKPSRHAWSNDADDERIYSLGNCFRTEEEAQAMADKFKELLKGGKE